MENHIDKNELISWLKVCLKNENITEISVDTIAYSEKGDNYLSDIVFAKASGTATNGLKKEFNLVLKCSKKNKILRESSKISEVFKNEIHVYNKIIPAFTTFQKEKGVENVFRAVPKFHGCFFSDDQEVIALEDVTKRGYSLWDKKKPMLKKHIMLVLEEYAKFHATSVALQNQNPKVYNELTKQFNDTFQVYLKVLDNFVQNFVVVIQETHDLLKNEIGGEILAKWKSFGERIKTDFTETMKNCNGLQVINHGDSWNNNFLFKTGETINFPLEVCIIDWQFTKIGSPITDISHFLFSCISEEDLNDFDNILETYYCNFSNFLKMLGSDPEVLYPKRQFLEDWKKYSMLGIAMTSVVLKVCSAEREEAPDITKAAEDGDYTKAFQFDTKDKTLLKNRIKPIIKFVVENSLI